MDGHCCCHRTIGTADTIENLTQQTVVKVKGVVLDFETQKPISGASLKVKGGGEFLANDKGEFQLEGNAGDTIIVAYPQKDYDYAPEKVVIPTSKEDLTILLKRVEMPEFPGGMAECMKFLAKNMKYPAKAQKAGIQGRVIVTFVVQEDGTLTDIEVPRRVDPHLDKEAIRIVKLMPKWTPGKTGGKPVRVKYTVPIMFRLK